MKIAKIVFVVFALLASGCSTPLPPHGGDVSLIVDKTGYSLSDTIIVTLQNNGDGPVFVGGCSPIYISSRTDTGWSAAPLVVCVWEGIAQKIESGRSLQQKISAAHYPGTHKFFALVYAGCAEDKPIGNDCRLLGGLASEEFSVGDRGNAAANLEIISARQVFHR